MIYNKIYDFCKARNVGNCFENGAEPTPRVKFLMELLDSEGISYELDIFESERSNKSLRRFGTSASDEYMIQMDVDFLIRSIERSKKFIEEIESEDHRDDKLINRYKERLERDEKELELLNKKLSKLKDGEKLVEEQPEVNNFFNIVLKGSSNKMVVAHHDIVNPSIDNANDNSASVINAIALKKLRPEINVVILDGEECGGIGSQRLSDRINKGDFGQIEWVLNLELSGKGGKYFFIGNYPGKLTDHIKKLFNCPVIQTPYNDSVTIRQNGIDSVVINPAPPTLNNKKSNVLFPDGTYLDTHLLHNCHSSRDTLDTISTDDMKEFVEDVLLEIVK